MFTRKSLLEDNFWIRNFQKPLAFCEFRRVSVNFGPCMDSKILIDQKRFRPVFVNFQGKLKLLNYSI